MAIFGEIFRFQNIVNESPLFWIEQETSQENSLGMLDIFRRYWVGFRHAQVLLLGARFKGRKSFTCSKMTVVTSRESVNRERSRSSSSWNSFGTAVMIVGSAKVVRYSSNCSNFSLDHAEGC